MTALLFLIGVGAQQVKNVGYRVQWVMNLMRDGGRQPSGNSKPLIGDKNPLCLLLMRDIAEDNHDAHHQPLCVPDRSS